MTSPVCTEAETLRYSTPDGVLLDLRGDTLMVLDTHRSTSRGACLAVDDRLASILARLQRWGRILVDRDEPDSPGIQRLLDAGALVVNRVDTSAAIPDEPMNTRHVVDVACEPTLSSAQLHELARAADIHRHGGHLATLDIELRDTPTRGSHVHELTHAARELTRVAARADVRWVVVPQVSDGEPSAAFRGFLDEFARSTCVVREPAADSRRSVRLVEHLSDTGYACPVRLPMLPGSMADLEDRVSHWMSVNGGQGVQLLTPLPTLDTRVPDRTAIEQSLEIFRSVSRHLVGDAHRCSPWREILATAATPKVLATTRQPPVHLHLSPRGTWARSRDHASMELWEPLETLWHRSTHPPHENSFVRTSGPTCSSCAVQPLCNRYWTDEADALLRSGRHHWAHALAHFECGLRTALLEDYLDAVWMSSAEAGRSNPVMRANFDGQRLSFSRKTGR